MTIFSLINPNLSEITSGGLFDFDSTLFFIIFQFLFLMSILNSILYKPILSNITERNDYIEGTLTKVSEIKFKTDQLNTEYEQKLKNIQVEERNDIEKTKKLQNEILKLELNTFKKNIDKLFEKITNDLLKKKDITLNKLDPVVQKLSHEIESKLLI